MLFGIALALLGITAPPGVTYLGSTPPLINGLPLSGCQALAIEHRSEFVIADALNDRVVYFDTLGNYLFDFKLNDNNRNPFGIAVNSADEIILSAMDSPALWIYDNTGRFLEQIDLPAGVFPGRLEVDSSGNIYVIDRAGNGVLQLDKSGNILARYESHHQPCKPSGFCFDKEGDLLLISAEGSAIIGFGSPGQVKYFRGEHGRRPEDFSRPTSAIVDRTGTLWVIDSFRHHIKRFESDGKFIDFIGTSGQGSGDFYFPVDLKMTSSGILGVLEKGSGRLQFFRVNYAK
jgi:DNA-binding beta-propeller fold protein YncE